MCSFSLSFSILDTFSFSPDGDSLLVWLAVAAVPEVSSLWVLSNTPVTKSALLKIDLILSPRDRPFAVVYVRSASLLALFFVAASSVVAPVVDPTSTGAADGVAACCALADWSLTNGASCFPDVSVEPSVLARVSERFCVWLALASPAPRAWVSVLDEATSDTMVGCWDWSEGEMLGLSPKPARPGVLGPSVLGVVSRILGSLEELVGASVSERVAARFLVWAASASPWPRVSPVVLVSCDVIAEGCAAVEALAAAAELKASVVGMVGFADRSGMFAVLSRADFSRMGRDVVLVASATYVQWLAILYLDDSRFAIWVSYT